MITRYTRSRASRKLGLRNDYEWLFCPQLSCRLVVRIIIAMIFDRDIPSGSGVLSSPYLIKHSIKYYDIVYR